MKDNLIFYDTARVIMPKKSCSDINFEIKDNLVEYKNIVQSDNFSFGNETIETFYAEKIETNNQFYFCDDFLNKAINVINNISTDKLVIKDDFIGNNKNIQGYEIVNPENNYVSMVGEKIYFECGMVTDNELLKEDFENLIWVSSLDGLIGIKNKFFSMLSAGEHIISLIMIENNNKIIKCQIKVYVQLNSTDLPEINKL